MSKSNLLLRALGKQFKDKHGHPSLKTSGATMPTSTGNRLAKLTRVITYVSVEGAVHFDSAEDDVCRVAHHVFGGNEANTCGRSPAWYMK